MAKSQPAGKSKPMPEYRVRESFRAKNVSLRITTQHGLEVVIPQGFDRGRIPAIVSKKQSWIEKTLHRLEQQRAQLAAKPKQTLPTQLDLRAIGETWKLEYEERPGDRVGLIEKSKGVLLIYGRIDHPPTCRAVLQKWLAHMAKKHLTPWLRSVSWEVDLPYKTASVRGQKTLWASCSHRKTISLNYKLLFLSPALVRYVLIHELSHTIHLNHSPQFWALVGQKEPNYKKLDTELRKAVHCVPDWLESPGIEIE
jgi:predicted metal-dependent hydrolase